MTPGEKQLELQRHHEILLATIDYLISIHAGSFVLDNEDHIKDYYQQQKLQIDKYFKQRRLDRLQQKLASLTTRLETSVDLNYPSFIKERTGYDIDLFDNLKKRVDTILFQNEIRTDKEQNDIGTMLHYLIDTSSSTDRIEKFKSLLLDYSKNTRKKKNEHSEVISRVEKDGIEEVTIRLSLGPKPKHFEEVEVISPDGLRKVFIVQWSDGTQPSTSVTIQFANGASGAIYASWTDNSTVSINTKNGYDIMPRHNKVRSFDDSINILYVDIDENKGP